MYISQLRGSYGSTGHTAYDAEVDAVGYWDFGIEEIAKYEIPALVDKVILTRVNDFLPCEKVQLINSGVSAQDGILALTDLVTSPSIDNISNVINITPCLIPTTFTPGIFIGIPVSDDLGPHEPVSRHRRNLSDKVGRELSWGWDDFYIPDIPDIPDVPDVPDVPEPTYCDRSAQYDKLWQI